eukprot:TRINITY_DN107457_c0_g1_i1.p1 TRINITY_DN107457_c0_g1~~TRINITY_DN107457_c0_g1_i1.p1  ORF type:complete len:151 (-),score=4.02 TRINITY_DN107457_c0_g1_i1:44-496(-)
MLCRKAQFAADMPGKAKACQHCADCGASESCRLEVGWEEFLHPQLQAKTLALGKGGPTSSKTAQSAKPRHTVTSASSMGGLPRKTVQEDSSKLQQGRCHMRLNNSVEALIPPERHAVRNSRSATVRTNELDEIARFPGRCEHGQQTETTK